MGADWFGKIRLESSRKFDVSVDDLERGALRFPGNLFGSGTGRSFIRLRRNDGGERPESSD
jgi:hypothetical protein